MMVGRRKRRSLEGATKMDKQGDSRGKSLRVLEGGFGVCGGNW